MLSLDSVLLSISPGSHQSLWSSFLSASEAEGWTVNAVAIVKRLRKYWLPPTIGYSLPTSQCLAIHPRIHSCIRLCNSLLHLHSFMHFPMYLFIHLFICLCTHSFLHSFGHARNSGLPVPACHAPLCALLAARSSGLCNICCCRCLFACLLVCFLSLW